MVTTIVTIANTDLTPVLSSVLSAPYAQTLPILTTPYEVGITTESITLIKNQSGNNKLQNNTQEIVFSGHYLNSKLDF